MSLADEASEVLALFKYWYLPPTHPASANCSRIPTATSLLLVSLWTVSLVTYLVLGSSHFRFHVRKALLGRVFDLDQEFAGVGTVWGARYQHSLGSCCIQLLFCCAAGGVATHSNELATFGGGFALWLLIPRPTSLLFLLNIISAGLKALYGDALLYELTGSALLTSCQIWPLAFVAGATRHVDDLTLEDLGISNTVVPLMKGGAAVGILVWICSISLLYIPLMIGGIENVLADTVANSAVSLGLGLLRLLATILLWLGALRTFGRPDICLFYLPPHLVQSVFLLWTGQSIFEALWSACFPSNMPWDEATRSLRDWKMPVPPEGTSPTSTDDIGPSAGIRGAEGTRTNILLETRGRAAV